MLRKSERLIFEKPTLRDFERYYEIHSDPETNLYNPYGPMKFDRAKVLFQEILDHWEEHEFGIWKIMENSNPHNIIGFGGLSIKTYVSDVRLNLGYRFDTNAWGKGYATELAKDAIQYGFNDLGKDEIYAIVRPKNKPSIKVLEKCNMNHIGYLDDFPGLEHTLIYKISNN